MITYIWLSGSDLILDNATGVLGFAPLGLLSKLWDWTTKTNEQELSLDERIDHILKYPLRNMSSALASIL
jgi:integral membrane sensor domain MASE1